MAEFLPADRARALELLLDSLPHMIRAQNPAAGSMDAFRFMPYVLFVADHGIEHFEPAMEAQYELTKVFTAEFSIRAYLVRYPEPTLDRLRQWTADPSEHVRRLVSEGTRPRLPWAPALTAFKADPAPVLDLLDLLIDDESEYVRRSVANNLNDISKDNPATAIAAAGRWWSSDPARQRLVRHGLRTLVKMGDEEALGVLGYRAGSSVRLVGMEVGPPEPRIGGQVRLAAELHNPGDSPESVLVDLRVHFVKADGTTRPKVFKGTEAVLGSGGSIVVSKTISVAQHTTRTHYSGQHRVEVLVNGMAHDAGAFTLLDPVDAL
jgi:3-methyladenine DNA glycosylase AlkC